jgi:hypothetical protein
MRTYSDRRWKFSTAAACAAIGIVSFATTFGSLAQKSEPPSPIVSIDGGPRPMIATPLANLHASFADIAVVSRPRLPDPCNDVEFSFLNSTCWKSYTKHGVVGDRHLFWRRWMRQYNKESIQRANAANPFNAASQAVAASSSRQVVVRRRSLMKSSMAGVY